MKTLRHLSILYLLLFFSTYAFSQYVEPFSTPNKGILPGSCSGTEASCTSDFTGETWSINGDFSGMDANDFISTNASGVLYFDGDVDQEMCFETPVLDISVVAFASLSVDVTWSGHDAADYVDVEYNVDESGWTQVPNMFGGGIHTIDFPTTGNTGSGTITQGGITGSTLSIRVCVDTNTFQENTTIDNVTVPEAGAVILPVKWADVEVRSLKDGNQLEWATYSEVNNDRFEIEKSVNGMLEFRTIGSIDGEGNSSEVNRYEFLDEDVSSATSYYRIKQIDYDGNFEYSEVVLARNNRFNKVNFSPNPFDAQILMSMDPQQLVEGSSLYMYNSQGEIIVNKKITSSNMNEPIETEHLSAGMYFIQFSNGDVIRLVKL